MGSGIDKNKVEQNLYQVLLGDATIAQARVKSEAGGYDVLPANRELSGAEIDLIQMEDREQQLKQAIALILDDYDFVLIDCTPTLSLLTINGRSEEQTSELQSLIRTQYDVLCLHKKTKQSNNTRIMSTIDMKQLTK